MRWCLSTPPSWNKGKGWKRRERRKQEKAGKRVGWVKEKRREKENRVGMKGRRRRGRVWSLASAPRFASAHAHILSAMSVQECLSLPIYSRRRPISLVKHTLRAVM